MASEIRECAWKDNLAQDEVSRVKIAIREKGDRRPVGRGKMWETTEKAPAFDPVFYHVLSFPESRLYFRGMLCFFKKKEVLLVVNWKCQNKS